MEILAAILTAVFSWAFVWYLVTEPIRRRRCWAGPLLLKLKRRHERWHRGVIWVVVGAMFVAAPFWFGLAVRMDGAMRGSIVAFVYFMGAYMVCGGVVALRIRETGQELRKHGIVFRPYSLILRPLRFTPWKEIESCNWSKPGTLLLQGQDTTEELRIDPSQMVEATAVLTEHVEVRDATGEIPVEQLRTPGLAKAAETDGASSRVVPGWFQFNLTALLLLMLAASSAFSWYGIWYRRQQRVEQVIASFERCRPLVSRVGSVVWSLDFSQSNVKPTDADLAEFEYLDALWSLNLDGSPITDAGLVHLEKLRGLRSVRLAGTQVTEEGVRRLQEKLPDATVIW